MRTKTYREKCWRHQSKTIYFSQIQAALKRIVPDGSDRLANGDAGQVPAVIERIAADGGDGIGDVDVGQTAAVRERIVANGNDRVGDVDTGQATATRKRSIYIHSLFNYFIYIYNISFVSQYSFKSRIYLLLPV